MSERNKRNVNMQAITPVQKPFDDNSASSSNPTLAILTVIIVLCSAFCPGGNDARAQSDAADQSRSTAAAPGDESAGIPVSGSPKIFFPDTVFDFGTLEQNASVSHTFVVKNTGNAPLKLIKAKGS